MTDYSSDDSCDGDHAWVTIDPTTMECDNCSKTKSTGYSDCYCADHMVISNSPLDKQFPICDCASDDEKRCQEIIRRLNTMTLYERCGFEIDLANWNRFLDEEWEYTCSHDW